MGQTYCFPSLITVSPLLLPVKLLTSCFSASSSIYCSFNSFLYNCESFWIITFALICYVRSVMHVSSSIIALFWILRRFSWYGHICVRCYSFLFLFFFRFLSLLLLPSNTSLNRYIHVNHIACNHSLFPSCISSLRQHSSASHLFFPWHSRSSGWIVEPNLVTLSFTGRRSSPLTPGHHLIPETRVIIGIGKTRL